MSRVADRRDLDEEHDMRIRKTFWRCAGAVALGLVSMGTPGAPAGADPGFVQLNIGVHSPQYSVNGCRYKIIYANYGSAPLAGVRLYGGCSNVIVAVRSSDANGVHWTPSSAVNHTGTDGCGSYTAIQAGGPVPGYATGASISGTGSGGSFWKLYDYDGDQTQAPHSLC
jgi:hypothetical protein